MRRLPKDAAGRMAARAHFMPKDARPILEHTNGSALYVYEQFGKVYAVAFWGTSARALWHYSFRNEDQRYAAIVDFKAKVDGSVKYREEQQAARKTGHGFKVGDIVNTSWGYDQTNVDFFVVTRVTKACVWVRQIAKDYEATGFMCGQAWPAMPIRMVGEETRHVAHGEDFSINGHSASKSEGRTHYESSYA
jgi:hypothetical protein